jgi:transcriptional regulator GlxA family with amidase domain
MNRLMTLETIDNEAQDCVECLTLLRRAEPNSAALASAAFALLLQRWLHALEADAQKSAGGYAVARSIQHMKATLGSAVSVEELAQLSGLSSRRFRQVFQAATGSSPKRYLDALRISTAESLLINTPFAIHEIANRLGYSSPFHFCKAFQKVHGIPPSQFRQNPLASRAAQPEASSKQQ